MPTSCLGTHPFILEDKETIPLIHGSQTVLMGRTHLKEITFLKRGGVGSSNGRNAYRVHAAASFFSEAISRASLKSLDDMGMLIGKVVRLEED